MPKKEPPSMRTTSSEWIAIASVAIVWSTAATVAAEGDAAAGPSRAELVHSWDLNKDGTIDEAEAEVARAKMRRAKADLWNKPSSEKPLVPGVRDDEPKVGPAAVDGAARLEGDPLGDAFRPVEPPPKKVAPDAGRDPPKRNRDLNAGRSRDDGLSTPNAPGMRSANGIGSSAANNGQGRGAVTGGVRAGAPALRPGYGAGGPKVDLNAGRLPAGLPPAQGMRPQVGSAPFRTGLPGVGQARGSDPRGSITRPGASEPPRPPLMPSSPTRITAEDIGLP
jgi:hypothetical protein